MNNKYIPACLLTVLVGLASTGLGANATAGDIYVIANGGMSLSPTDVKDVFLGEKQFSGSTKIVAVDNGAAQDEFLAKVLRMDSAKYNASWTKKSFRDGLIPPSVKLGDAEVVEFVKRTPGAVGYVSSKPANVTVVQKY